jgi:hypothetical protein
VPHKLCRTKHREQRCQTGYPEENLRNRSHSPDIIFKKCAAFDMHARRAIAVRPETTLLFFTGVDSPVRDGVPLTTAPSKGTPGNVLWTCEVGGLFAV